MDNFYEIDIETSGLFTKAQIRDLLIREMESFSDEELMSGVTIAVVLFHNNLPLATYSIYSGDYECMEDLIWNIETSNSLLQWTPSQSAEAQELLNSLSTVEQLLEVVRQHEMLGLDIFDFTSLPTFGGEEPSDTNGIYSWDTKNLLVQCEEKHFAFQERGAK